MGLLEVFKKACEINFVKPILDPPDWADTYVGPWLLNDLQDLQIVNVSVATMAIHPISRINMA